MSETFSQFLARAMEAAERNMTAIQKGEYHPRIEVLQQSRTVPQPAGAELQTV